MIPQHFPLYAVDATTRAAYVVVGWRGWPTDTSAVPVLAPLDGPGPVTVMGGGERLAYSTSRPAPNVAPAPDETVVMNVPVPWPPR